MNKKGWLVDPVEDFATRQQTPNIQELWDEKGQIAPVEDALTEGISEVAGGLSIEEELVDALDRKYTPPHHLRSVVAQRYFDYIRLEYSEEEIAKKEKCSVRTVEKWMAHFKLWWYPFAFLNYCRRTGKNEKSVKLRNLPKPLRDIITRKGD